MSHDAATREFATAVMIGLSDRPRWLPCRYLYDERGSELFEAITGTAEYYPTRTESAILAASAAEIAERSGPATLVELGAGSSAKTGPILDAFVHRYGAVNYLPVDVSRAALDAGAAMIAAAHPGVSVSPVHRAYEAAFPLLRDLAPVTLIFLGSTVGNFNQTEAATFWTSVTTHLPAGSHVLLGVDLVKDPAVIDAAYNDAAGYSAAFTRNIFARMNRELNAGLDLGAIEHEAAYRADWQRVEIFARFRTAQTLRLEPIGRSVEIAAGERIMTEISRKYVLRNLEAYLDCFGLVLCRAFTDPRGWFAVLLLERRRDSVGGTAEAMR